MSDFWSNVLGNTPQPDPAPAPTPQADVPWWQRTVIDVPTPPPPASQPMAPQPEEGGELDPEKSLQRTQWARETTGNCPGCNGPNYDRHPEAPSARPRCFDCGYPITQTGSGVTVQGEQVGPVQAARQIPAARTNNFNPNQIVHHMHPQQKG